MRSMGEIKSILMSTLNDMGYNPYNLLIKSFETETQDNTWNIEGEFRGGYMGDTFSFQVKYDPHTDGISKFKISGGSSETGYA